MKPGLNNCNSQLTSASVKRDLLILVFEVTKECSLEVGLNLKILFKRDLCCSMGVTMTPFEDIFVCLNRVSLTTTLTIQYELTSGALTEQPPFYLGNKNGFNQTIKRLRHY